MARNLRALLQVEPGSRDCISVLLVEDDSVNLMVLKHTLESAAGLRELDLRVETCTTVEAMLERYSAQPRPHWDLVILDEHLTDKGKLGHEGMIELKRRGAKSKFICCSGDCLPESQTRFLSDGADAVWPKVSGFAQHGPRLTRTNLTATSPIRSPATSCAAFEQCWNCQRK